MHNKYNKEYIMIKSERDEYIKQMKLQNKKSIKEIRETHASRIKADH